MPGCYDLVVNRRLGPVVLLLIALFAACSGGDAKPASSPSETAAATPSGSPSPSPAATASPRAPATPTLAPTPPAPQTPPAACSLGYPFLLRSGETVSVDGEGLTITYERLLEDSRCPEDVQCIWEGNGRILLTLAKVGSSPAGLELNTALEPGSGRYLDYSVDLVELGREEPPAATLQVSRI
jgi:hypothetical protein